MLSLLNQLSDWLQFQNSSSSTLFADLSNVVYYGISGVLESLLSSCSGISWTLSEVDIIYIHNIFYYFPLSSILLLVDICFKETNYKSFLIMNLFSQTCQKV